MSVNQRKEITRSDKNANLLKLMRTRHKIGKLEQKKYTIRVTFKTA